MSDTFQVWAPRAVAAPPVAPPQAAPDPAPESEIRSWRPPAMDAPTAQPGAAKTDTAAQQKQHQAAREQAVEAGYQEGLARGEAEARALLGQQSQQLQLAIAALRQLYNALDGALESEILELSLKLACQLLGRELEARPDWLVAGIDAAVAALPGVSASIDVFLHPADLALINAHYERSADVPDSHWQLQEDSRLSRGGFRLGTDTSRMDQTLETRLAVLVRQAFADSALLKREGEGPHA